jgi:hypothetical protein
MLIFLLAGIVADFEALVFAFLAHRLFAHEAAITIEDGGPEHGARIKQVGALMHGSSRTRRPH